MIYNLNLFIKLFNKPHNTIFRVLAPIQTKAATLDGLRLYVGCGGI